MAADLRALTLTPEWAWAVCHLGKRVENRTWRPPARHIGKIIAIHAGKARPDWDGVDLMAGCAGWRVQRYAHVYERPGVRVVFPGSNLVRGAIVALATVRGVRDVDQRDAVQWECGPVCWDLDEVRVLARPVPCKGALGLWRVPAGLVAALGGAS
jgi:hypothetical protein